MFLSLNQAKIPVLVKDMQAPHPTVKKSPFHFLSKLLCNDLKRMKNLFCVFYFLKYRSKMRFFYQFGYKNEKDGRYSETDF